MRNSLLELPVFLCCLWGGLLAGFLTAVLRLPKKLYEKSLKGRRARLLPAVFISLSELAAAALIPVLLALTLLYANGGEPRAYAIAAFLAGVCAVVFAADSLIYKK